MAVVEDVELHTVYAAAAPSCGHVWRCETGQTGSEEPRVSSAPRWGRLLAWLLFLAGKDESFGASLSLVPVLPPFLFNWQSWKCSLGCQLLWLLQCVCLGAHGLLLVRFRNVHYPIVFCHLQGSFLGPRSASFNQHILINYLYLLAF